MKANKKNCKHKFVRGGFLTKPMYKDYLVIFCENCGVALRWYVSDMDVMGSEDPQIEDYLNS